MSYEFPFYTKTRFPRFEPKKTGFGKTTSRQLLFSKFWRKGKLIHFQAELFDYHKYVFTRNYIITYLKSH